MIDSVLCDCCDCDDEEHWIEEMHESDLDNCGECHNCGLLILFSGDSDKEEEEDTV